MGLRGGRGNFLRFEISFCSSDMVLVKGFWEEFILNGSGEDEKGDSEVTGGASPEEGVWV